MKHTDVEEGPVRPVDVWRHDRNAGLVLVFATILVVYFLAALADMLVPGLASALPSKLSVVLPIGLLIGLGVALVYASTVKRVGTVATSPGASAVDTALASVRLTILHKTPLRLISFLEDARRRHLLRTVGPVYQFRHATLQDRLAPPTAERSARIGQAR